MTTRSDPTKILEERYFVATNEVKKDGGKSVLRKLSKTQIDWLNTIVDRRESLKAVLTVLITSLTIKLDNPHQDIRLHKEEFQGGYSGRTYDTKYVTPFMKARFHRLAMKESGWLTRSIEQPHPFNRQFPGKIRDERVKDAFLRILEDIEEHEGQPDQYLTALFILLINQTADTSFLHSIAVGSRDATINRIMSGLEKHFYAKYKAAGASRLPVVAIYSIYQCLVAENTRYKDKRLLPLRSHTTSDFRSKGIGDIELVNTDEEFFEGVEIKHMIPITAQLVEDAIDKFQDKPVKRYYLLTTAEPCISTGEQEKIKSVIQRIEITHGCEVIVNGTMPSLRYYLRLLNNPALFLKRYSQNLEAEFSDSTDIKEEHLREWQSLRERIAATD